MFNVKLLNGQISWAKWLSKEDGIAISQSGEIRVERVGYGPFWPGYSFRQV